MVFIYTSSNVDALVVEPEVISNVVEWPFYTVVPLNFCIITVFRGGHPKKVGSFWLEHLMLAFCPSGHPTSAIATGLCKMDSLEAALPAPLMRLPCLLYYYSCCLVCLPALQLLLYLLQYYGCLVCSTTTAAVWFACRLYSCCFTCSTTAAALSALLLLLLFGLPAGPTAAALPAPLPRLFRWQYYYGSCLVCLLALELLLYLLHYCGCLVCSATMAAVWFSCLLYNCCCCFASLLYCELVDLLTAFHPFNWLFQC